MRTRACATGLALALWAGCAAEPSASMDATVIDEAGGLGMRLDRVRVLLLRAEDGREVTRYERAPRYAGDASGAFDPVVVRLLPERQQDAGRVLYRVRAEGVAAGAVVVSAQHRLVFVPGRRIVVPLRLWRACLDTVCDGATTCSDGTCVDDELPPCSLEGARDSDFCQGSPPADAGPLDAAAADARDAGDASPPDAPALDAADMAVPDAADMAVPDAADMAVPDAGEPPCSCPDDGLACTVERCDRGLCRSTNLPDGTRCGVGAAVCCGGSCVSTATDPAHCGGCGVGCAAPTPTCSGGTCLSCTRDADCGDDGLDCTLERCLLPAGVCTHPTQPGTCLIDAVCVPDGQRHARNACLACDAAADPTSWTPLDTTPCDDGFLCTDLDYCDAGVCTGVPRACSDGLSCTADRCDPASGRCENPLSSGCLIGGACYAVSAQNPANGCQVCDPMISTSAWTSRTGACQDGLRCTSDDGFGAGPDACVDGVCVGVLRSCADSLACTANLCDEAIGCTNPINAGRCVIDGACRVEGAVNAANACLVCVPTTSQTRWTDVCDGG